MRLKIVWIDGWAQAHGTGPDGKRIRKSLKTRDPRRAEEARANIEARLWKIGLYGAEAVVTFDECAVAYAEDGGEARFLPKITAQLAGRTLKSITPKEIRDAARRAYPAAKAATINRQGISPARAVMNYGHKQGWCGPMKVEGFPIETPQRRAVDRPYLDALCDHLPERMAVLMRFLNATAVRISEAIRVDVEDVDLKMMRVLIRRTKNGEPRIVYLTSEVAEGIARIMPETGRVWDYAARSSVYPTLRRACKKAGIPYLGTHQIGRHSFATMLDASGWTAKQIAEAGGWKSPQLVAKTYSHPVGAAESAAQEIGRISAGGKPRGAK